MIFLNPEKKYGLHANEDIGLFDTVVSPTELLEITALEE